MVLARTRLGSARPQRARKNSPVQAEPWKSGPSGPRKRLESFGLQPLWLLFSRHFERFSAASSVVPSGPENYEGLAPEANHEARFSIPRTASGASTNPTLARSCLMCSALDVPVSG